MRRAHRLLAGVLAAGALALSVTGCGGPAGPADMKAAGEVAQGARSGLPPVVDRVPTENKVVFLVFGDEAQRDPDFVPMVKELRLPVSLFLTGHVAGPGYAHLGELASVGATVQNHTLDHPYLPGLPYEGQRWEICGQQHKLKTRFGQRPRLLRPPHGAYDTDTLRAAADCGITALVRGRAAGAQLQRLQPGDIILPHAPQAASLTETTTRLVHRIRARGFRVARLEDYL
ncbi:polysaccharide deacetylase family protein [Streptomyces sp. KLOTTS4A1]|uniref:polysaccharide deacetylase family protein n=1 Tax=Streptomyces sp. KLOTTS4A1 TaxID=3390996 RepID=UPI0039F57E75